jgi:ParB/RepB/Spo0J family partition protein
MKGFGIADIVGSQKSRSNSIEKIQSVGGSLDNISKIPVAKCFEGNFQPRSFITEEALSAMCNSISNEGQHQPIIVYLKGKAHQNLEKNDYFVVSGHTRLKAFKTLGLKFINAMVYTNINKALVASVTTNEVSTGLHIVDKGTAMQSLLDSGAFNNQNELAEYFSCSQTSISRYLSWNVFPVEIKAKIVEFNITSKSFLADLKKRYKKFHKGKIGDITIEELDFESISDIEEFSNKKKIKVEKKQNSEKSEITNFLYMKNEKFKIRERAISKLSDAEREQLLETIDQMIGYINLSIK